MKTETRIALVLVLLVVLVRPAEADDLSVLFIGNSHTEANGLDQLFAGLAGAAGHAVVAGRSTVGGSTLSYHSHHEPTLSLIGERAWDHVVLQEHTLLPVIPYWVRTSFHPSATRLDSLIVASGSSTTLFLHWARPRPSGPYCVEDHCSRAFDDYFDMQAEMAGAYWPLADELDAPLVPVGAVWARALREHPDLPLWSFDGLHPSLEGSYFTACIFHACLLGESPAGLAFHGGLDAATAAFYQELAWEIVSSLGDQPPPEAPGSLRVFPNPVRPEATVEFSLDGAAPVELAIYDAAGSRVRELLAGGWRDVGRHRLTWDGRDGSGRALPSGVYVVELDVAGTRTARKMVYVR